MKPLPAAIEQDGPPFVRRALASYTRFAPVVLAVCLATSVASSAALLIPTVGGIEVTSWLIAGIAGIGLSARLRASGSLRVLTAVEWAAMALVFAASATVILGPGYGESIPGLRRIVQHVTILVAVVSLTADWRSIRLVVAALLVGMAFQGAVGVAELVHGSTFFYSLWKPAAAATWQGIPRIASTPADPNYFALGLVSTLPLVLLTRTVWPRVPRVIQILAVALAIALLGLTFSRAGYLGLVILLALRTTIGSRNRVSVFLGLAIASAVLVVAILAGGLGPLVDRLLTLTDPAHDASLRMRLAAQLAGVQVFAEHPFFGIGFDRFVTIGPPYVRALIGVSVPEINVLNSFLLTAAEGGVVALTAFSFATWWSVKRLLTFRSSANHRPLRFGSVQLARASAIGLLVYSIVSLTLDGLHSPTQWVFFGLAGLFFRYHNRTETGRGD